MANLLCVTSGVPGVLFPGVELARRLAVAGHRVTYAAPEEARSTVERQDLDFLKLAADGYPAFLAQDRELSGLSRLGRLRERRRRALQSLGVGALVEKVREREPDLILIDGELHEQILGLAANFPVALLNSFASIWRRPGLPPPSRRARPGVGFRGSRLGLWWLWSELRLRKRFRAWAQAIRRVGCDRRSLLRQLAQDHGLDFRRQTDASQWLIPFTYRHLPVLSLHAAEFEFPHRPPRRVRYVGPMVLQDRGDAPLTDADRAQLEALFERRRSGRCRLIYAGFGSFLTASTELLHRLARAVEGRADWELVISLGGRLDPASLGRPRDRVHVFGWLPQLEVLDEADLAVTHGGINTLDECVLAGVPMLIYCGFETDMAGNTSRVEHHGIGLAGDAQRDTPGAMRERLDRLLIEPGFARRIERMRAHYLAYTENRAAEDAVETLLGSSRRVPS